MRPFFTIQFLCLVTRACMSLRLLVSLLILLTVASFVSPTSPALAAQQKSAASSAAAGKPAVPQTAPASAASPESTAAVPAGIALADIAARATEVSNLISGLTATAAADAQITTIDKTLPDLTEKLDTQLAATSRSLRAEPSLEILQTLQQQWQRAQVDATTMLNVLTQHATKLQNGLSELDDLQKLWRATLASAQQSKAPDPILQQIDATLKEIAAGQEKLQVARTDALDLQSRVAKEVGRCSAALTQIGQYQQKAVAGIFYRDAPPIWHFEAWTAARVALADHIRNVVRSDFSEIVKYFREPREGVGFPAAFFFILVLVFCAARAKLATLKNTGDAPPPALSVFQRPYSAALTGALVFATSPFFQITTSVRQFLLLAVLVPMIRLAQPVVSPSIASWIYLLCALFAVETLRQAFAGIPVFGQAILVAESLAAIVSVFYMRHHYGLMVAEQLQSSRLIFLKSIRFVVLLTLFISLVGAALGYLRLARLLTPGILIGGVLGLATFVYLRVASGVIALAFCVWPMRRLHMVEHHRELIAKKIYRLLVWMAIIGWSVRYLGYLGLLDPAWSLVEALLAAKLERGTISISIGNVVEFLLTVSFAYLLSRFLRFVLEEDFYPRIDLAPGLSYAVSSLLNYIIIALGFVAGLGVLGVDFNKVSVLAGAFGVGIGFGLQSIVNNFVSGLILLFERPMHVGDTIELGNLQGTVRRIGIRASVIHTGAGADIIVPNSQLITDKVTNWTLSDRLRRVDLPVGVNYGADPKKVIELLEQTAQSHPDVLPNPAPRAFFTSYGDNAINFELRVWPKQLNMAGQVKSDLAAAVYDAVIAAGLSFPFPQREVRLLGDANSGLLMSDNKEVQGDRS